MARLVVIMPAIPTARAGTWVLRLVGCGGVAALLAATGCNSAGSSGLQSDAALDAAPDSGVAAEGSGGNPDAAIGAEDSASDGSAVDSAVEASGSADAGGDGPDDANAMSGTQCGATYPCGTTGVTEQTCQSIQDGACVAMYITTSDGQTWWCASCTDCVTAGDERNAYCLSLTSATCGSVTCPVGDDLCCSCGIQGTLTCESSFDHAYDCQHYGCQ